MMKTTRSLFAAMVLGLLLVPGVAFGQTFSGTLRTVDGTSVSAAQLQGRVSVLLFGGTMDPQSPDELPVLARLSERYAGRTVDVYWVSLDPQSVTGAQLTQFAARHGFRGRILRDNGDVLRGLSGNRRPQLPTIVVLDQSGAIAGKPMGGFDRNADMVNKLAGIVDPLL